MEPSGWCRLHRAKHPARRLSVFKQYLLKILQIVELIDENTKFACSLGSKKYNLLHPSNEKKLYSQKSLEKPAGSVAIAQPSDFGGWLSVQASGGHLVDAKLFFNFWRNLQ